MKTPVTLLIVTASTVLLLINGYRMKPCDATPPTVSATSPAFKPTVVRAPKIVDRAQGQTEVVRSAGLFPPGSDETQTVLTQASGEAASSAAAPVPRGLQSPRL
jgi:hypothetical protein